MTDGSAYDDTSLSWATFTIENYVDKGARSKVHVKKPCIKNVIPDPEGRGGDFVLRRLKLQQRDFLTHGYTEGCQECNRLQTGFGTRRKHTEACRGRMQDVMEKTHASKDCVEKSRARMEQWDEMVQADHHPHGGQGVEAEQDTMIQEDNVSESDTTSSSSSSSAVEAEDALRTKMVIWISGL